MKICKVQLENGQVRLAQWLEDDHLRLMERGRISDILHGDHPKSIAQSLLTDEKRSLREVTLLPPIDAQEVWAAGVTYKRSQEARERESVGAAKFYDLVYSAARPEIFFKSPAYRVAGSGGRVHIRRDSKWNVPEPELALVISPHLKLVGFTIGNDMSSRDIEGENPLYLPQAKYYDGACALGPAITLAEDMPKPDATTIRLIIERSRTIVFENATKVSTMKRSFDELIGYLGRELSFPHGAILLTGTGIIPPDEFTLAVGDVVHIDITGIGRLTNVVQHRE